MALPRPALLRLMFGFLCLVWGATWLAMKAGVSVVPPGFFSGTRWTMAGLLLLAWRRWQGLPIAVPPRLFARIALVGLLMVVLNAVIQQYGLRQIGSGLGAVLTSAITPLALLGFGVALGQERFTWRQGWAILLGLAGIALLFGPKSWTGMVSVAESLGAVAVVVGTVCYCAGSVLARPLMRTLPPAQVAALSNLVGGIILLTGSLLFEPGVGQAMRFDWGAAAWTAWLFLLLPGSLGATIIYFVLVRDWGASRAGTFAFVSPVISVLLGVAVLGERVEVLDAVGMALMLSAAAVVIRRAS